MRSIKSSSAHAETVRRLTQAIERGDLTVFAQFDHATGARAVGMELPDELVVAFAIPEAERR